jgi:tRNA pseudouridine55 synthase
MNGILLLKKPTGISSARVLNPVKRVFPGQRVGHTGTLDPFASGLMIVLVGSATRLSRWFLKTDKRYSATITLGAETDTLDTEGSVVEEMPVPPFEDLQAMVPRFLGSISQVPPVFSALKVDGKRAYERARRGEDVTMTPRNVEIHDLTVGPGAIPDTIELSVHCGSGTYIRSLARDLARAAGTRGYCSRLERTAVGPFDRADAVSIEELDASETPGRHLIPVTAGVTRLGTIPIRSVSSESARRLAQGKPIEAILSADSTDSTDRSLHSPFGGAAELFLYEEETSREVAIVSRHEHRWRYETVFPVPEVR